MTEAKNEAARATRKGPASAPRLAAADIPTFAANLIRFHSVGQPADKCWLWPGEITNKGYGRWNGADCHVSVHRAAYALAHGDIPAGVVIRHRCDVRACFNPDHLEAGTQADNVKDMYERGRGKWDGKTAAERREMMPWAKRGKNAKSKRVIAPDGREWPSALAAGEAIGMSGGNVAWRCRTGSKGWRFG